VDKMTLEETNQNKNTPKEAKQNKLVVFFHNNLVYSIFGAVVLIFQVYQMIDFFVNKVNKSNITVGWKDFVYIIFSIILSIIIFILLYKNIKKNNIIAEKNNIINSLPYKTDDLREMKKMGISKCTSRLADTDFTPINCMNSIKKKLFFMGVGGVKWIYDPPTNLQLFKKMLLKVSDDNGEVRFLVINPFCESFELMRKQREGATVTDSSYKIWIQLVKEFKCLQVKCYDHTPTFRLQFMDDGLMAVSKYQFQRDRYDESNHGWGSPHLIIDNCNVMSLYTVFERYYLQEWKDAKDITKIKELY